MSPGHKGHVCGWHEDHRVELALRKSDQGSKICIGPHPAQQGFSGLEQQCQEWESHMVWGAHNNKEGRAKEGPQRFQ